MFDNELVCHVSLITVSSNPDNLLSRVIVDKGYHRHIKSTDTHSRFVCTFFRFFVCQCDWLLLFLPTKQLSKRTKSNKWWNVAPRLWNCRVTKQVKSTKQRKVWDKTLNHCDKQFYQPLYPQSKYNCIEDSLKLQQQYTRKTRQCTMCTVPHKLSPFLTSLCKVRVYIMAPVKVYTIKFVLVLILFVLVLILAVLGFFALEILYMILLTVSASEFDYDGE